MVYTFSIMLCLFVRSLIYNCLVLMLVVLSMLMVLICYDALKNGSQVNLTLCLIYTCIIMLVL